MNINGSTIHVEGELGLTGLGYVEIYKIIILPS